VGPDISLLKLLTFARLIVFIQSYYSRSHYGVGYGDEELETTCMWIIAKSLGGNCPAECKFIPGGTFECDKCACHGCNVERCPSHCIQYKNGPSECSYCVCRPEYSHRVSRRSRRTMEANVNISTNRIHHRFPRPVDMDLEV